jgi:hypothetical protein
LQKLFFLKFLICIVFSGVKPGDFCPSVYPSDSQLVQALDYAQKTGLETIDKLPYTAKVNGRVGEPYTTPGPGKIAFYQSLDEQDFE